MRLRRFFKILVIRLVVLILRLAARLLRLLGRKVENVRRGVVVLFANDDLDAASSVRIKPVDRDDLVVEKRDLDRRGVESGNRRLSLADAGESLDNG